MSKIIVQDSCNVAQQATENKNGSDAVREHKVEVSRHVGEDSAMASNEEKSTKNMKKSAL